MWLIAGLGNPGEEYKWTRHNIGFIIIDEVSRRFNISLRHKTKTYIYGRGKIGERDVILLKPLTFMNRSGLAIRDAFERFKDREALLVIHDDLDLELGVIKIKKGGSSGGHHGVESVIHILGDADFIRLKIGIGRSQIIPPERYVLSPFTKTEMPVVERAIERAVSAVSTIVNRGVSHAQNVFNTST